jgi:hypothetical protein
MKITLETDSRDPIYHSKIWRTYKCGCGCQDVRVADASEIVKCPDCGKRMEPLLFVTECSDGIILSFHRPLERLPKA